MRRLLAIVLVAMAAATLVSAAPANAATHRIRLGGVSVLLPAGSTQVLTVKHTHGYHARAVLWVRDGAGAWRRVLRTRGARTGYGGLVRGYRRHQGSGTTPLGTYRLPSAFGRHAASASWRLPYRRITAGDYWVGDNASAHYNQFRNKSQGGFRWWLRSSNANSSEHLRDYPAQYEYVVTTSFNPGQVRHRGTAIFLHVNGRGATAGCVSVPRVTMQRLLAHLDPARTPVIAIGR